MRNKKKSKSKRIREALIKDGINYIIGFSKIPAPLETIKEFIKIRREETPSCFVDWQLENWPKIYFKELGKCVKIPFKSKEYLLPQVLVFDNTKNKLNLSNIYFRPLIKDPFELRYDIKDLTESSFKKLLDYLKKRKIYSNEQNLRLVNIIVEEEKKLILEVQPVEYKYYIHTNLVLDAKSNEKKQTLREYIHSKGELEQLKESPLANNLGINILLFTACGSLIMQKRSRRVAFRVGELCPSASGTLSLTDVPEKEEINLENMPKLREAFEEIGITKKDIPQNQIYFLGITRELIRGGEPEMFFFAKTILSEEDIKKCWREEAKDKWESENLTFFPFGQIEFSNLNNLETHIFFNKIDEFIDKYGDKASIPLLTSIALWIKYLTEA